MGEVDRDHEEVAGDVADSVIKNVPWCLCIAGRFLRHRGQLRMPVSSIAFATSTLPAPLTSSKPWPRVTSIPRREGVCWFCWVGYDGRDVKTILAALTKS
jgi:hypothetical protein